MKNKFMIILAAITLIVSFTACSSGGYAKSSTATAPAAAAQNTARDSGWAMADMGDTVEKPGYSDEYEGSALTGEGAYSADTPAGASSRMVVKTVNMTMQTMEFDAGVGSIKEITEGYGGFIQDSYIQGRSMYDKYGARTASFTLRIPSENLDSFVDGMGGRFNVTDKRESGQDITDTYFDTEARLKALKVQEESLIEMLDEAGDLEYLLQVRKELANVRYEIESLTSSLLRMQDQVSMSTVYLNIEEVVEYSPVDSQPATFGEKLSRTFRDSFNSFKSFVQGTILVLVWLLPFLALIAIVASVIVAIAALAGKKRGRKASVENNHAGKTQQDEGVPPEK